MGGRASVRGLRRVVAGGTLATVALLAVAPAFGCGATNGNPQVSPARAEAGAVVNMSGTAYRPELGEVFIKWGTATGTLLASAPVNADGTFGPVPVTIPASAEPSRFYQITVYQPAEPIARSVTVEITSTPAPQAQPAPAPAPANPSSQPATGSQPAPSGQPLAASPPAATATAAPAPAPRATARPAPAPSAPAQSPPPVAPAAAPGAPPAMPSDTPAPSAALDLPEVTETDPAGLAATGAPTPAQPLVVSDPAAMGGPRTIDGGPSLWVLVPLVLVGLTLFAAASAVVVHELRRRRLAVKA